ncbi:hypothetical protein BX616_006580, partial [Lobosporangium transversale]
GHYEAGHYEVTPYNDNGKRSVYHVRKYDIYKMLQVKEPLDVFLSHDWPLGIERYGDTAKLLRVKKHFIPDVQNNRLGSKPYEQVLRTLRPAHWYSAHLHVRFTAVVQWDSPVQKSDTGKSTEAEAPLSAARPPAAAVTEVTTSATVSIQPTKNPDEIDINFDDEDENDDGQQMEKSEGKTELAVPSAPTPAAVANPDEIQIEMDSEDDTEPSQPQSQPLEFSTGSRSPKPLKTHPTCTKFLALDKCLPGRKFLEIVHFPELNEPIEFKYDEEWLAIVRTLDPFLSLETTQKQPLQGERLMHALKVNREWVQENVTKKRGLAIPLNFQPTAPAHDEVRTMGPQEKRACILPFLNPQTEEFCAMLQIPNKINPQGRRI